MFVSLFSSSYNSRNSVKALRTKFQVTEGEVRYPRHTFHSNFSLRVNAEKAPLMLLHKPTSQDANQSIRMRLQDRPPASTRPGQHHFPGQHWPKTASFFLYRINTVVLATGVSTAPAHSIRRPLQPLLHTTIVLCSPPRAKDKMRPSVSGLPLGQR